MTYMTPPRRAIEMLLAIYATGFGLHVWWHSLLSENTLEWTGMYLPEALRFGQFLSISGLIHMAGVRINGSWRWSPVLRLIGMLGHLGGIGSLWVIGEITAKSAGYTYGFLTGCLVMVVWMIVLDVVRAAKNGGAAWSH